MVGKRMFETKMNMVYMGSEGNLARHCLLLLLLLFVRLFVVVCCLFVVCFGVLSYIVSFPGCSFPNGPGNEAMSCYYLKNIILLKQ